MSTPISSNERTLRAALERIARWHGEFPATGRTWPGGDPMSYAAAFGSNGERDFMRQVAREALEKAQFETNGDDARRTAEYWKAEHLAGNAEIDRLRVELREARLEIARTASEGLRAIGSAVETPAELTVPLRDFNRYLDHMYECAFLRDADSASPTYGKCTCGLNELVARLTVKSSGEVQS